MIWIAIIGILYGACLLGAVRPCLDGGMLHDWHTKGDNRHCKDCRQRQYKHYYSFEADQCPGPEDYDWKDIKGRIKPLPSARIQNW